MLDKRALSWPQTDREMEFQTTVVLAIVAAIAASASSIVAIAALAYVIRADRRKSGLDIRCGFGVSTSIYASEGWIWRVTLQNRKDRSVTIYKIYVEVGHGFYVGIDDFDEQPLLLEPYGSFQKQYDPIEFYAGDMYRWVGVFADRRARQKLVLATAEGRYPPKRWIKAWDPVYEALSTNRTTIVVDPVRLTYKGRSYGSETKFIVTFTDADGREEIVPIHAADHQVRKFRDFRLTMEALKTREALESFLRYQVESGRLHCAEFTVLDLEPIRLERYKEYKTSVPAPVRGWFVYNVLGRCWTLWDRWRLHRANKKSRKQATTNR